MTIAKMYIDAMKAKAVGYLVIAQTAAYMVVLHAVKAVTLDFNAEEMAEEFMQRIIQDERSRYIIAESIIFTVAQHRYLTDAKEISFEQRLYAAKFRFNASVKNCEFVKEYMAEYNEVQKPIEKFVMDNVHLIEKVKTAKSFRAGAITVTGALNRLISLVEGTTVVSQDEEEEWLKSEEDLLEEFEVEVKGYTNAELHEKASQLRSVWNYNPENEMISVKRKIVADEYNLRVLKGIDDAVKRCIDRSLAITTSFNWFMSQRPKVEASAWTIAIGKLMAKRKQIESNVTL